MSKAKKTDKNKININIAGIWMVIFCAFFMLFLVERYVYVLESKYLFFVFTTIAMVVGIALFNRKIIRIGRLSITDIAVIVFLAGAIVSTLTANPYSFQALIGHEGRYAGLILLSAMALCYFAVSRVYRFNSIHIDILMASAVLTAAFGVLDYFNLSILGYRERFEIGSKINNFFSTMGNADTYAAVLGVVLVITALRFILEDKSTIRHIAYAVAYIIILSGIVVCGSDGALLTLIAVGAVTPLIKSISRRGLIKWIMLIALSMTVLYVWGQVEVYYTTYVLGLQGIYHTLAFGRYTGIAVILLWIVTVVMKMLVPHKESRISTKAKRVYIAILIMSVVAVISAIIYVNVQASKGVDMGEAANYAVFSDAWGTQRGYIWRATIEEYSMLPIIKKIVGTGPDTLGIWMSVYRYSDMTETTRQIYDNAHNEYLQYLLTQGLWGLVSMLVILISTIVQSLRSDNRWMYIIGAAVLGYAAQAVVGIGDATTLPVLWTLIAVAASMNTGVE